MNTPKAVPVTSAVLRNDFMGDGLETVPGGYSSPAIARETVSPMTFPTSPASG